VAIRRAPISELECSYSLGTDLSEMNSGVSNIGKKICPTIQVPERHTTMCAQIHNSIQKTPFPYSKGLKMYKSVKISSSVSLSSRFTILSHIEYYIHEKVKNL
jgi:hypothetical protein